MKTKGHPFPEWRPNQLEAVESCVKAVKRNKKFIILEGPTGAGKSSVAVEILRRLGGGRILTSQVLLQEQYKKDYPEFQLLKGSGRYSCHYEGPPEFVNGKAVGPKGWEKIGVTDHCGESTKWMHKAGIARCGNCNYLNAVELTARSKFSIMNYHSYYFQNKYRENLFKGNNIVLDEAHNLNNVTTSLYTREFKEFAGFIYPKLEASDCHKGMNKKDIVGITNKDYVDQVLQDYLAHVDNRILVCSKKRTLSYRKELAWLQEIRGQVDFQIKYVKRPFFTYNMESRGRRKYLVCKPIDVRQLIRNCFYEGNQVKIFMSATILDTDVFCKEMGLDQKDVHHVRMHDVFDPTRHLIRFVQEPKNMQAKGREFSLKVVLPTIKKILERHQGQKGLIHAQTYKVCEYINNALGLSRITFNRNIMHALSLHREKMESVLLSPAMKEGVDLPGRESEFQIMVVVPYPTFDLHTVNKMKINGRFYQWATAVDFVQSLGRSVRTVNDTCVTYLIDSRFYSHIKSMEENFSPYLQKCLPFDMEKINV